MGTIPRVTSILVIKLRAIGDVLLSTVVLPDLRAAYPEARIDFLCELPAAPVLEGNAAVNGLIVFDPSREHGLGLIRRVRHGRYDMVIDLFGNPRSAIVALCSGARIRVGYRFGWRRFCYTQVVEPRGGEVHNMQFNQDAIAALGVPIADRLPEFPLDGEARAFADAFYSQAGLDGVPCIGINSGGGWYTKRWDPEHFAGLARRLLDTLHCRIVLFWGPGERERAEDIDRKLGGDGKLIPSCTLKQLGGLLRRCNLLVTNDSGPMHIAAALGVPVVAIFGPTNPRFQGPVGSPSLILRNEGLDCLGCNLTECPIGLPCMHNLSVDDVYGRVRTFIDNLPQFKGSDHAQP